MNHTFGIVLSGGGARGVAHLGLLKALETFGIRPAAISGTSAGAIAGAFYAKGFTCDEIVEIIKKGQFFSFSNLRFDKHGLFTMKAFEKIYSNFFPTNSFSDLSIPLHVAATDIQKGEVVYLSSGNLAQALMATSCIPMLFQPISYQNTLLVDGGILNNLPIEPLLDLGHKLIACNVNSIQIETGAIAMNAMIDRCFHIATAEAMRKKSSLVDFFIEPPDMSRFSILDLKRVDEIYAYGYTYGLALEADLKERFGLV